jgi:hypothetical protein
LFAKQSRKDIPEWTHCAPVSYDQTLTGGSRLDICTAQQTIQNKNGQRPRERF